MKYRTVVTLIVPRFITLNDIQPRENECLFTFAILATMFSRRCSHYVFFLYGEELPIR